MAQLILDGICDVVARRRCTFSTCLHEFAYSSFHFVIQISVASIVVFRLGRNSISILEQGAEIRAKFYQYLNGKKYHL